MRLSVYDRTPRSSSCFAEEQQNAKEQHDAKRRGKKVLLQWTYLHGIQYVLQEASFRLSAIVDIHRSKTEQQAHGGGEEKKEEEEQGEHRTDCQKNLRRSCHAISVSRFRIPMQTRIRRGLGPLSGNRQLKSFLCVCHQAAPLPPACVRVSCVCSCLCVSMAPAAPPGRRRCSLLAGGVANQ